MKIYLVGGAVRDMILDLPVKERDYVVVGATPQDLIKKGFKQVGKEFPVFLHPKTGEEYALARAERKVKPGYTGFEFDTSPEVTLEEDLKRRDLTINAMAYDLEKAEIIDPFGGRSDAYDRILRNVSPAFAEDPVRILRAGRFLARFAYLGFRISPDTINLMRHMVSIGEVNALVAERVWKEFERALAEKNPEKFFDVIYQCRAAEILFPYLVQDGPGIKALMAAVTLSHDPLIRFAALLHHYPEHTKKAAQAGKEHQDERDQRAAVRELCKRYKIPNQYKELVLITATHWQEVLQQQSATPEQLLKLFTITDSFRREIRFHNFLLAVEAIANSKNLPFDADALTALLTAMKSIDVQGLIQKGFANKALAEQLAKERLKVIQRLRQKE